MQREISFDKLEHFIAGMKERGIGKLAFAEVREKRAMQVEESLLQVVDVMKTDILAYRDSTIYKCRIEGTDPDALFDTLSKQGFEIVRRSRNIT
jgi:hypothetical protein